jgi:hypothetical protein
MRSLALLLLLTSAIVFSQSTKQNLIIKQVYYTGSKTPAAGTYFSDQFIEIYNNSADTVYTDSLFIGDVYGNSGQINASSQPTPFASIQDSVYLSNVWMIPGSGKQHPLAPGKSIIIAQDGINHKTDPNGNANSPVDLSTANWETYNERPDNRDADAPGVPNLTRVYFTGGFDWLLTVFGPAVVIFTAKDSVNDLISAPVPGSTIAARKRLHVSKIIDGFEALMNASSSTYKRIPTSVDAGFVYASGTYTSETSRRKIVNSQMFGARRFFFDTNNSTEDFEVTGEVKTTGLSRSDSRTPGNFALEQNYPNPFNPATTIRFSLPARSFVRLSVYDVLGNEVAVLLNGDQTEGMHSVPFNASSFSSGVYFYQLSTGARIETKRMQLIK